jgi:hypothetical protein
VRADQPWDVGVGACSEHPGSIAREGCSLAADYPCSFGASLGCEARRGAYTITIAAGEATQSRGGDP